MSNAIEVSYTPETKCLRIIEDETDDFNVITGDEAEQIWNLLQTKLQTKTYPPAADDSKIEKCWYREFVFVVD